MAHIRAHWRHLANTIDLCFLRPIRVHNPNSKSIGSAILPQVTAECRQGCLGMSFPLITAPLHGDLGPTSYTLPWAPSNTWFPGSTRVLNRNSISIGSAVFVELTTGRPTDHANQSVTTGRIYVHSTVMQANNRTTTSIIMAVLQTNLG